MTPKLWLRLVSALTPDCNVVTQLVSESRERPLTAMERVRLRWHYRICEWCRRYQEQLKEIGAVAKHAASPQSGQARTLGHERKAHLRSLLDPESD